MLNTINNSLSPIGRAINKKIINWDIYDNFSDGNIPAGSITGTYATDGINLRTANDTNLKLSIGSDRLNRSTGSPGGGDPGLRYPSKTKVRGMAMISAEITNAGNAVYSGWSVATSGLGIYFTGLNGANVTVARNNGVVLNLGTSTIGELYYVATILRLSGCFHLIKGGTQYPYWNLLYTNTAANNAAYLPMLISAGVSNAGKTDFARIPTDRILILPIASDSFNRANGSIGVSDGAGTEETATTTPSWIDRSGTANIVSPNIAGFSALTSSLGVTTLESNSSDVIVEVEVTRTSGNAGICLRWIDANNNIFIFHNGTNIQIVETVSGTPTTLLNTAITYVPGARLSVYAYGNKLRLAYSAAVAGGEITTSIINGTSHGIYSTTNSVTSTFNNFVIWSRGTSGEYESMLNDYIA